jgi:hypothetical protein
MPCSVSALLITSENDVSYVLLRRSGARMKVKIYSLIMCVAFAVQSSPVVAADEHLEELATVISQYALNSRFDAPLMRKCFVETQNLIDGSKGEAGKDLASFLEEVCQSGIRSELERQGILSLFQNIDIQPMAFQPIELDEAEILLAAKLYPCWNAGVLSREAQAVKLSVSFAINETGHYDQGSISLIDAVGGSEQSVVQAFEAARRAILRCLSSASELSVPPGEYKVNFPPN